MERDPKPNKAYDVYAFLAQRWPWFGFLFMDRRIAGGVTIDGFSVRYSGGLYVIVVRGLRVEDLKAMVVFGRGETLYQAFNNVTSSISKLAWRADKYRTLG